MNDLYSGPPLDRAVFEAASVPAGTLAATERLRREGAIAPALSAARILELQRSPPGGGGVLRAEPRSELAMERVIDGPAGPLRSVGTVSNNSSVTISELAWVICARVSS